MCKIRRTFLSKIGFWLLSLIFTSIMSESTGLCKDVTTNEVFSLQIDNFDSLRNDLLDPTNQISHMLLGQFSPEVLGELYSTSTNEIVKINLQDQLNQISSNGELAFDSKLLHKINRSAITAALLKQYSQGEQITDARMALLNQLLLCDAYSGELSLVQSIHVQTNCSSKDKTIQTDLINKVSRELDKVDHFSQEWGRATVSDIALIDNSPPRSTNGGYFDLQYNQPTTSYVAQAASVQGAATVFVARQTSVSASATFTSPAGKGSSSMPVSPTNTLMSQTNTISSSSNTNSTTAGNGSGSGTNSESSSGPAYITPTTLAMNVQPQLSGHQQLIIGLSDKETERILNYMSDPIDLPDNKRAYIGVMQVSLLPGWRTRQGYGCEVQVEFEYAISKEAALQRIKKLNLKGIDTDNLPNFTSSTSGGAEALKLPVDDVPAVISAFPFAEDQVLDLSSSLQNQLAFLAQISGSLPQYPALQASLKAAYNKLTQQSLATVNALPLVIPSSEGSDVTYRFSPELQALLEPGKSSSPAGHVLEPSSFPALVVIICDDKDLVDFDSISAAIQTRWIPFKTRHWFKFVFLDWWRYNWGTAPDDQLDNSLRLDTAHTFDLINDDMFDVAKEFGPNAYVSQEIKRRFENLKTTAMGRTIDSLLPSVRPFVTAVTPPQFRQDSIPDEMTIEGHYFKSALSDLNFVGFEGVPLTKTSVSENVIKVTLSKEAKEKIKQLSPGQHEIELVTSAGETPWENAVAILPVPPPVLTSVFARTFHEHLHENGKRSNSENLTILGQNFDVKDRSLKVAVGGAVLPDVYNRKITHISDQSISMDLRVKDLGLPPGNYNLTVATSGGQAVLTNVVVIDYRDVSKGDFVLPPVPPIVTAVYPNKFRLDYAPSSLHIIGNYFSSRSSQIRAAELGAISLQLQKDNPDDHSLVIPLLKNELAATNYDLELVNDAGPTILSNAVQILPVPAPVVTAAYTTPVSIGPFSTNNVYPMFSPADFINLPAFANELRHPQDNVSAFVVAHLTELTTNALAAYQGPSSNPVPLQTNLVQSFDALINGQSIYDPTLFASVSLRTETKQLLVQKPQRELLLLLNRLLLEDAYPLEIASPKPVKLTIRGQYFAVGDNSLKITIGGILITNAPTTSRDDQLLSFELNTNELESLKPGIYDLTLMTSGGSAVLTNAVQIAATAVPAPIPSDAPIITGVYPKHGFLYAPTEFYVTGSNFMLSTWGFKHPVIRDVTVGGEHCEFKVVSPSNLKVTVPPWANFVSSNTLVMATTKLDIVVGNEFGTATLTNAVYFDLPFPERSSHRERREEKEGRKSLVVQTNTNIISPPPLYLTISLGSRFNETNGQSITVSSGVPTSISTGMSTATVTNSTANSSISTNSTVQSP